MTGTFPENTIDPEALDNLIETRPTCCVSFEYDGFTVTVRENAEVTLKK